MFLLLAGDDEHADEVDPELIGPFTTRNELIKALELLPLREESGE